MKTKIHPFFLFVIVIPLIVSNSCRKDEPEIINYSLNKEEVSLTSGLTFQLVVEGNTKEKFSFDSNNDLIATIDSSGLIEGIRVGETSIHVKGKSFDGDCIVNVIPLYNTFKEPVTNFGITKNEVKSLETRTLLNETEDGLLYEGGTNEKYAMYLFENGKLTGGMIIISSYYSSILGSYIAERYVIVSMDPIVAISIDEKFAVMPDLQDNFDWWVMYFPNPDSSKKADLSKLQLLKYQNSFKDLFNN